MTERTFSYNLQPRNSYEAHGQDGEKLLSGRVYRGLNRSLPHSNVDFALSVDIGNFFVERVVYTHGRSAWEFSYFQTKLLPT